VIVGLDPFKVCNGPAVIVQRQMTQHFHVAEPARKAARIARPVIVLPVVLGFPTRAATDRTGALVAAVNGEAKGFVLLVAVIP
jgi:hypothetical protein